MSIKELIGAIERGDEIKDIEPLIKDCKTLNVFDKDSGKTPLDAALSYKSPEVFQLLVIHGADPFLKQESEKPSVIETLSEAHHSCQKSELELFEWMMTDKKSPVFNWERLAESDKKLFDQFDKLKLIPNVKTLSELPLHVAIQAGRLDLIKAVIKKAGSIQKAGDISHMSILKPAIQAMLEAKANSQEILDYLLKQGANPQISDSCGLPAIMQTIAAQPLYNINTKEKQILKVVQLLHKHGASLEVTNPNDGTTPLMAAMGEGFKELFYFLLDKASTASLNQKAKLIPHFLIFQLFDSENNKLTSMDMLKLLSALKRKGLKFNKTLDYPFYDKPYESYSYDSPFEKGEKAAVSKLSILHFYIDKLKDKPEHSPRAFNKHLKIIQALITHGANPQAKASFTLMKKDGNQIKTIELTASEYLIKLADKIPLSLDLTPYPASLIKDNPEEADFLNTIRHSPENEQKRLHHIFHGFKNLERVLSGKKPLPYSGLPNRKKRTELTAKKPRLSTEINPFNPEQIEQALIDARKQKNNKRWTAHKKTIENYIKSSDSPEDFLARTEQFKKALQLHFQVETNSKGEIINRGSMMHRFFHCFDPLKFPSTWERLRKFGQNCYGIDINTQYNNQNTNKF